MAASRSSSRSRRSARKGPRGRKLSNVRVGDVDRAIKKAELRRIDAEADLARATAEVSRDAIKRQNNHHIAADGSRQPGLNPPTREELRSVTDAVLDETLEKKLAELRSLVSRMEIIASIVPTSGRAAVVSREQADCIVADGPTRDRGAIDAAGGRVRRLANIVENIRATVAAKAEMLLGPTPSTEGSNKIAGATAAPSADVHALFTGLDHLDSQVERLEHELASLLGQL